MSILKSSKLTLFIYAVICAFVLLVGIIRPGITGYKRAMLEDMIYGKAHRPFVTRCLVPMIIRGTTAVTPKTVRTFTMETFARSKIINRLGWPPAYATEFVSALVIMYVSLIAFLIALRRLLLNFTDQTTALAATCLTGLSLPITFCYQIYLYDFTQLALFTAALLFLLHKQWSFFYPVFILGCLNKETTILLPIILAFWSGKNALRPPCRRHIIFQLVIWLTIYLILQFHFQNNPGGSTEWHLARNAVFPLSPSAKLRLLVLAAVTGLSILNIRRSPGFLKAGFWVTLPILIIATLFFGYIDELRDYYEALPFIAALCSLNVRRLFPKVNFNKDVQPA